MKKMEGYKKLTYTLTLVLVNILGFYFELDEQVLSNIQNGILMLVGSQGLADAGKYGGGAVVKYLANKKAA